MTIACLVLAYGAPSVLACSLPTLREAGCHTFVHLDRKVSLEDYIRAVGHPSRDAIFIEDRVEVFWGGYSMMEAEFKLIEAAQAAGEYDKYVLISDDSVPVLPGQTLAERLPSIGDQISFTRQDDSSPFTSRYRKFFCYDHPATMVRGHNSRSVEIDEDLERKVAEIAVWRRIGKKPLDVYHGSQYWALTVESVSMILDVIRTDIHILKSFQYSALSDELMIQSILGNKLSNNSYSSPMYADFSRVPGPRVYTEVSQLPYDLDSRHVFIRKISPTASLLLKEITQNLRNGNTIKGIRPGECLFGRQVLDESGEAMVTLRLCAPASDDTTGWQGLESAGGRQFRWTASDRITWDLHDLESSPSRVRFVITTVVNSAVGFVEKCKLMYASQTVGLESHGGSLVADFAYQPRAPFRITLLTPPPISPREARGHPDGRKLGLAIAV